MANRVTWTFVANDKFSRAAASIKKKTAAMRSEFARLNVKLKQTSDKLRKAAKSLTKFGLAAAAGVAGSLKAFGNLEQGIANTRTLLSKTEWEQYGERINRITRNSISKFGIATDESTKGLFDLVSALQISDSTLDAYEASQELAIAGVSNLGAASLGVARMMTVYSAAGMTATDATNAFFVAQLGGTTDVEKLARNIGKVAATAKTVGITYQEVLSTAAEFTNFFTTEESMTGFKALIKGITQPGDDAAKVLRKYGVATSVAELNTIGFMTSLDNLRKMADTNKDHLGRAIPAMEAFNAAAVLSKEGMDRIRLSMERMESDKIADALAIQMATLNRNALIAKGNIVILADQIGEKLKPAFILATDAIVWMTDEFKSWNPIVKTVIAHAMLLTAIVVPALLGLAAIIGSKFLIAPAIIALKAFLAPLVGVIVAIGWIPFAIAAAVVGIVLLIKNFDLVKEKAFAAWGAIKEFATGLFGGDEMDVTGSAEINHSSKAAVTIGIQAAPGIVKSLKTRTSGNTPGLEIATHLVGET